MLILYILSTNDIMKPDQVVEFYYGDSIITADNIPYKINTFSVFGYVLCQPQYYSLDDLPIIPTNECVSESEKFEKIFFHLIEEEYTAGQQDPNLIYDIGGDCQAFAIYLRKSLTDIGLENGFIPSKLHVCNWVVLDGVYYKVDLTTKEVSVLLSKEKEKILKEVTSLEKY